MNPMNNHGAAYNEFVIPTFALTPGNEPKAFLCPLTSMLYF